MPAADAAPALVARREMAADVAERECAEYRIAERVDQHVAIGMGNQSVRMRNADAAEYDMVAGPEGVDVESLAYAHAVVSG